MTEEKRFFSKKLIYKFRCLHASLPQKGRAASKQLFLVGNLVYFQENLSIEVSIIDKKKKESNNLTIILHSYKTLFSYHRK